MQKEQSAVISDHWNPLLLVKQLYACAYYVIQLIPIKGYTLRQPIAVSMS